jgi:hypothetical protein
MSCVDQTNGRVDPRRLGIYILILLKTKNCLINYRHTTGALANWNRSHGIENVLVALRSEMASAANKRLPQHPEGSTFS